MSIESAKSFLEKMKSDSSFSDKLKAAKSVDDTSKIVKAAGFDFTEDELSEAQQGELDDEELDSVAGGSYMCFGDYDVCNHD